MEYFTNVMKNVLSNKKCRRNVNACAAENMEKEL